MPIWSTQSTPRALAVLCSTLLVACGTPATSTNEPINVKTPGTGTQGATTGGTTGDSTGSTTGKATGSSTGRTTGGSTGSSTGSDTGSDTGSSSSGTTSGTTGGTTAGTTSGTGGSTGSTTGSTTGGGTAGSFNDTVLIDFGAKAITNGSTTQLTIPFTVNDESFSIVAIGLGANSPLTEYAVRQLTTPAGVNLTSGDVFNHKNRSYGGYGAHGVLVAQTPDIDNLMTAGNYTFVIEATDAQTGDPLDSGSVYLAAMVKKKTNAARYKLDLNLFFTGSAGLTATTAKTVKRFTDSIAIMRTVMNQANVDIANINYIDIDEAYQDVKGIVPGMFPDGVSLAELQRQSSGQSSYLNFFFVEYLIASDEQEAGRILGIAGGIPGPAGVNGTDRSGVVVLYDRNTWPTQWGNDPLGITMAHEGSHFLGLFHVGELNQNGTLGSLRDNISDTTTADTNLMYPLANPDGGLLTPMQSKVLRRNPLVHQ